ncbi:PorV/PorQ family protein [candidate division KSB1 bacterium]|nr:PorV/PorQ family protein [candidate division KSB1 bacterium]
MNRKLIYLLIAVLGVVASVAPAFAEKKKLAQTGFQFLSVPIDARAAGMGEALTSVANNSTALFHNPANMALMNTFADLGLNQNKWIADIQYSSGSFAINPWNGRYGVIGFSLLSVNYGDMMGTMVDESLAKGYRKTGLFSPSAFTVGLGYAKALTDRFAVGGHIRYVRQELGASTLPLGAVVAGTPPTTASTENSVDVMALDFGTIYRTDFKSLVFGMTVQNFSQEIKYQREGFQLPLTFKIGISMNVLDFFLENARLHALLISIDALHPRDYSERVNIGAEYLLLQMLAVRAGYMYNYDERDFTIGLGIQKNFGNRGLSLDYAYTPFGVFDNVSRMSVRISL